MLTERFHSDYGVQIHRKQVIHTAVLAVLVGVLIAALAVFITGWRSRFGTERKELLRLWEKGVYEEAFRMSREKLVRKPMDYFLLTLNGFSAYQLAIAQINAFDTLTFTDDAIWSLRKALLTKRGASDPRVFYVLGKAYYYKGNGYADLAVKYLEKAQSASYNARDIPEYLGLAYAAVHDYRNSVASFTRALNPEGAGEEPSDLLLLSIARSYMQLEEPDTAKAYLLRCIDTTRDAATKLSAKLLLGIILGGAGDSRGAEALYLEILEIDSENAEAHFQLGELYAAEGDATRARAEWRRAYRIDPFHSQVRARLNM
ncbi:MAG: tetratricopeptide repeat protein [Treponema sp.]|jgi:tetratricopeptide (TPR) repeat protein|nr:tetratricopeptide repeat protein [Treponema sp.]